jgi:hypothetical protein
MTRSSLLWGRDAWSWRRPSLAPTPDPLPRRRCLDPGTGRPSRLRSPAPGSPERRHRSPYQGCERPAS